MLTLWDSNINISQSLIFVKENIKSEDNDDRMDIKLLD